MISKQTQNFQAETKELLDLMIHSLYSHREIFLRELISNASDAISKLKFESLTQPALLSPGAEFEIRLEANPELKTLSITDNGIGMSYEEAVKNLGTIAHSGTKSFQKLQESMKDNPDLIGQFGVGFYSAFMVADRVTVHTRKAGTNTGILWESDGSGTYTVEEAPRSQGHGTTITLHLKKLEEDEEEKPQNFTDTWTLRGLVKKYSDFVTYPIRMKVAEEKTENGKTETIVEDETLNSQKALWLKPSSDVSEQEYQEFYKHLSHDWNNPLKTIHYKAEGTLEFASVLYIPAQRPFDYDYRDRKTGINLYVKRVFIKGDCEELLPPYLRFVKGMVDSDDLSLNVSREILQQDRQILKIKKALTGKVLSSLRELQENDRASYVKFWDAFGPTLKEGIALDSGNIDKLQDLTLFYSTESEQLTTLKEYTLRMKPDQKAIYYITGETLNQIRNSPYLEKLKAKGFEVILMVDRVDAWVASSLTQYDGKSFQSIMAEDLDLTSEDEKKAHEEKLKEAEAKLKPLMDTMQETLKESVKEIKLSNRLTDSPVCLVTAGASSAHMERLLQSMGQAVPKTKRVLEINPEHPLYEKMLQSPKDRQEEWAEILYQQALLNEGSPIENPLKYSQKIAQLMMSSN